ncbi:hypothetical protein HKBW3C_02496, partial [Candidatus Hakubella thermalkaliphila]
MAEFRAFRLVLEIPISSHMAQLRFDSIRGLWGMCRIGQNHCVALAEECMT